MTPDTKALQPGTITIDIALINGVRYVPEPRLLAAQAENARLRAALRDPATLESCSTREALRSEMLTLQAQECEKLRAENERLREAHRALVLDAARAALKEGGP